MDLVESIAKLSKASKSSSLKNNQKEKRALQAARLYYESKDYELITTQVLFSKIEVDMVFLKGSEVLLVETKHLYSSELIERLRRSGQIQRLQSAVEVANNRFSRWRAEVCLEVFVQIGYSEVYTMRDFWCD